MRKLNGKKDKLLKNERQKKIWSNGTMIKEERVLLEKKVRNTANKLKLEKKGAKQYRTMDSAKN